MWYGTQQCNGIWTKYKATYDNGTLGKTGKIY